MHDDWWYKSTGSEIVKSIAQQRDDIEYLGVGISLDSIVNLKSFVLSCVFVDSSQSVSQHLRIIIIERSLYILKFFYWERAFHTLVSMCVYNSSIFNFTQRGLSPLCNFNFNFLQSLLKRLSLRACKARFLSISLMRNEML